MDRQDLQAQLSAKMKTPSDRAAVALMTSLASLIHPALGGFIGAADRIRRAHTKAEADALLLEWIEQTSGDLAALEKLIELMNAEPDETGRAALLSEVLGYDLAKAFLSGETSAIGVILNPATVEELQEYVRSGLLAMTPTHSQSSMGAGNRIGGHVEELKRPYGTGHGFVIALHS
jgi:hypothetical protein